MVYETTSSRVGVPEKRRFLCLSFSRERRSPAAWTMQQKCCNNNTRSLPASPDTIRYYLYTFHPPPDRPTNQQRPRDVQKRIHQIRHHHPHSHHTENHCKIHQLHQYLPDFFSVRHETYLTYLTSPHLTFLGSHPKKKTFLTDPTIHPSIREDRSRRHQLTISKSSEILLSESSSYYLTLGN